MCYSVTFVYIFLKCLYSITAHESIHNAVINNCSFEIGNWALECLRISHSVGSLLHRDTCQLQKLKIKIFLLTSLTGPRRSQLQTLSHDFMATFGKPIDTRGFPLPLLRHKWPLMQHLVGGSSDVMAFQPMNTAAVSHHQPIISVYKDGHRFHATQSQMHWGYTRLLALWCL